MAPMAPMCIKICREGHPNRHFMRLWGENPLFRELNGVLEPLKTRELQIKCFHPTFFLTHYSALLISARFWRGDERASPPIPSGI